MACGQFQLFLGELDGASHVVGDLLASLRRLTNGYQTPSDGCASYQALFDGLAGLEADTHRHVHKENNLLFPAVVALEARRGASTR